MSDGVSENYLAGLKKQSRLLSANPYSICFSPRLLSWGTVMSAVVFGVRCDGTTSCPRANIVILLLIVVTPAALCKPLPRRFCPTHPIAGDTCACAFLLYANPFPACFSPRVLSWVTPVSVPVPVSGVLVPSGTMGLSQGYGAGLLPLPRRRARAERGCEEFCVARSFTEHLKEGVRNRVLPGPCENIHTPHR